MQHRSVQQFRRLFARPASRLAVAAVGTVAAAAAVVGVAVNEAPAPAGRPAPAGIAAANLGSTSAAAVPASAPSSAAAAAVPSSAAAASTDAASSAPASTPAQAPTTPAPPRPPAAKSLDYVYEVQTTYYYCGPAATRIALSVAGRERSQDDLAARLYTTVNGTNSAVDTTRVLNAVGKGSWVTRELPGPPSPAQLDRLRADAVRAIGNGRAIVANIVGGQADTEGGWHDFPGGHYLTVVGYKDNGRLLKIADPAYVNGQSTYWMTTIDFANWMTTRGYSA